MPKSMRSHGTRWCVDKQVNGVFGFHTLYLCNITVKVSQ